MADSLALVQQGANTSTGTQDFTSSGFGTPKGAIFFVTLATANGSAANHAAFAVGATDGSNHVAGCGSSQDAADPTVCKHIADTVDCITLLGSTGTVIGRAQFSAFITDGIRINWSVAPSSAYLVTCLLLGGSGVTNVHCGVADVSDTLNAETDITAPGFEPSLLFCWTTNADTFNNTVQANLSNQFGVAVNNGGGSVTSRGLQQTASDAVASTNGFEALFTGYVFAAISGAGLRTEVANFDSSGFSTFRRNQASGSVKKLGYVAVKLSGLSAKLVSVNSPTGTGAYSITGAGFTPQFALLGLSSVTAEDTILAGSTSAEEVFGIGLVTASAAYCHSVFHEAETAAAANTESMTDSKPVNLRSGNAAYQIETFTAFTSDGMTLNATTANGTVRKRFALFIEAFQEPAASAGQRGIVKTFP